MGTVRITNNDIVVGRGTGEDTENTTRTGVGAWLGNSPPGYRCSGLCAVIHIDFLKNPARSNTGESLPSMHSALACGTTRYPVGVPALLTLEQLSTRQ